MALVSLTLLVVYTLKSPPAIIESLVLFPLAAAGGLFLLYRDITNQRIPKWLAIGHGLLAVTGYVFLWIRALA